MRSKSLIVVIEQATLSGDGVLAVSGWAAGDAPVERVEIEIAGRILGRAEYGGARPDVAADRPDLVDAGACGFALTAHAQSPLREGWTVAALARDETGCVASAARPLKAREDLRFHCDTVEIYEDGAVALTGWAAHREGVAGIDVRLDGARFGAAETGISRPDVARRHPDLPGAARSGFVFRAEGRALAGEHDLTLVIVTGAGDTFQRHVKAVARPVPSREASEIRLVIDSPRLVDGALAQPFRRMLAVEGWAAARHGLAALEATLDGAPAGDLVRGVRRRDIAAALPGWPEALSSGFALLLPRKAFSGGRQILRLTARDALGATQTREIAVEPDDREDERLALRAFVPAAEIAWKRALVARAQAPAFAVLIAPGEGLAATLASLRAQAYPNFRTGLVAPESADPALPAIAFADAPRLLAGLPGRPFLMVLRAGDTLGADALLEFAVEIATRPELDFVYADDRRPDPGRGRAAAFLKPDWSPDLLLSTNYIGRAFVAALELLPQAPRGDYDLALRLTEAARAVGRAPLVLVETPHRETPQEEAAALDEARRRRGIAGSVETTAAAVYRLRREAPRRALVSVIVPTIGAGGWIETCLASLRSLTLYPQFEIVCIDNIADPASPWKSWLKANADIVVERPEPFNWSRLNNFGAAAARGDYLLFLNDDTQITDPGWLDALMEQAQRPEVGIVGPRLLYPDGRVQQAGMYLAERDARHAFHYAEADDPGPFGLAAATREVACVTGACMLMRREVFESVGGFAEPHAVVNNDVDMCLKMGRAGLRVIYTPHATLIHREMASRGEIEDGYDETAFAAAWGRTFARGDPFFHPRLSREDPDYAPEPEPTRVLVAGGPLRAREEVARLLVVKLDNVGDFVTALPAIRRLKARFPRAEICVLAAPASLALARLEPAIAEAIEFGFFSAVSQEGPREIGEEEWRELEARLRSRAFDIAIDLRKQAETRDVLRRTGARLLAGFDRNGAFPWLDVALEWEGDAPYRPKRAHVSDDYVALVEAVWRACEPACAALAPPAPPDLPAGLVGRPFVAVHAAAGSALRQWPLAHFKSLIDLLLAAYEVDVALIGTQAEADLAEEIAGERVWPLYGRTCMEDLPGLLGAARLFIGNNSGPHHIAAALGTPTVGVHSGVVSAREWGPAGPIAVAVQREMSCAPCYLDRAERCPRALACLTGLTPAEVFRVCEQMLGPDLRRKA